MQRPKPLQPLRFLRPWEREKREDREREQREDRDGEKRDKRELS